MIYEKTAGRFFASLLNVFDIFRSLLEPNGIFGRNARRPSSDCAFVHPDLRLRICAP